MFNGLKRGIVICACAALAVSCMDYGPIEKEALEPMLSRNIIKLQITDNHILSKAQSKSKSF